jgi:hypothetical protein
MNVDQRVKRINEEMKGVSSLFGITSWEKNFLLSIENRKSVSEKQEKILARIEEKVFEEQ